MDSADCVRNYKSLANVERAFRSFKTGDLEVRPIHHRLAGRVRAHIFLCMLAYYVEWHMREAWREMTFADEDQDAKKARDPVAPAKRSPAALHKIQHRRLDDGTPVHSFSTLLPDSPPSCATPVSHPPAVTASSTFQMTTVPTSTQQRALQLLQSNYRVATHPTAQNAPTC